MAPTWATWGVDPGDLGGMFRSLYLDICPAGLQSPMIERVDVAQRVRPVTFDNPGGAPLPWVDELGVRPTVYVTLGTVANHTPQVFETVIAAVSDQPLDVVVTVGPDRDPAELGVLPPHVHAEPYLPQSLVLPSCDLVVCHGGSGTTLAALSCGLPLLLLPQEANQFWNADRTAALGAGRTLRPHELGVDAVRSGLASLLNDPAYRVSASRLADEIAAMPAPHEVVGALEALVPPAPEPRVSSS